MGLGSACGKAFLIFLNVLVIVSDARILQRTLLHLPSLCQLLKRCADLRGRSDIT